MTDVDAAVDESKIETRVVRMRLGDLKLLDDGQNARFMTNQEFTRLVSNLREDGALTSVPLARLMDDGRYEVVSGNHRVQAAIEAFGRETEVDVMVTDQTLSRERLIALQLSHNAIVGQDDPAILKALYEEIDDIDWREYVGLDDEALGLLDDIDIAPLSEPNLEFQSLSIMFLPHELEAAVKVVDEAKAMIRAGDERWAALYAEHDRVLDALDLASGAHDIKDRASSLAIILDIFQRHAGDLVDGFVDDDGSAIHDGWVPIATVTGTDRVPAEVAARLHEVVEKMVAAGEVVTNERWRVVERLAAAYLEAN